jgi:hypothetical protein
MQPHFDTWKVSVITDNQESGIIMITLNDTALGSKGIWLKLTDEFHIGEIPPSKHNYWRLPNLTYPLEFTSDNGTKRTFRVYSIPSLEKGGLGFKIYREPGKVPYNPSGRTEGMSPSMERLANLLTFNKQEVKQFVNEVFNLDLIDGKKTIQFGQIAKYVKEIQLQGNPKPTAHDVIDYSKRLKKSLSVAQAAGPSTIIVDMQVNKKKRKSTSIWPIRN